MSETPCPFCGQIHGTACNATGDATTPAVVQDAQRYDYWREDLDRPHEPPRTHRTRRVTEWQISPPSTPSTSR